MEAWRAGVRYSPHPALTFRVGGGKGEHRGLGVRTGWSLFGGREAFKLNETASGLNRNSLFYKFDWKHNMFMIATELWWHQLAEGSLNMSNGGKYSWYTQQIINGTLQYQDHDGNVWILKNEWCIFGHSIAPEWNAYLGGYGTLRGIHAGSLMGNNAVWFSAEFRLKCDCYNLISLPLMSQIQPVVFINGGIVNFNQVERFISDNTYWLLSAGLIKSLNIFSQTEHLYFLCGFNSKSSVSLDGLQLIIAYEP